MAAVEGVARRAGKNSVMVLAVLTATVAQLLDLGTFVRMVAIHGPVVEGNPIVNRLLLDQGVFFVAVTKIVALALVVAVIAVLAGREQRPRHVKMAAAVAGVAIAAGLLGGWTNAIVIL